MEQLVRLFDRLALMALVAVLLGSVFATASAAPTPASTTYTLTGYVDQPGGASAAPVPAGVTVDLVSAATGTVYKAVTAVGGVFSFSGGNTGNTLGPGYWKLVVPTEANVSVTGCGKCAVLPLHQNPTFSYYTYAELTSKTFATVISDVAVYPYNATLNGTVMQGAQTVTGVKVNLLDANFNGLILSNTTTNASGEFSLKAPFGSWLLQSIHVSGSDTFTNTTAVTISKNLPPHVNPVLSGYSISGWINSTSGRVPATGNATLFDPTNGLIYSVGTPAGGYYSLPTYLAGFSHGPQNFDVVLGANGYGTTWYPVTVSSATPITRNVVVNPLGASSMGVYTTVLNFTGINPLTGKGTATVSTAAVLGNDSVVPSLPNASVGQLWAQLGLDFNHSIAFPEAAKIAAVQAYFQDRGPFFLATQAGLELNTTTFTALHGAQTLASFASTCASFCGLSSAAHLAYNWSQTYTLNGTLAKNASSYTIGFTYQHPASSSLVYNYSVVLPSGYVLSAGTSAPVHTTLTPTGPAGTWSSFVLSSTASSTASAAAKFTIVRAATVTPVVNVTSANFTFSSANVLNESENNYTVVLGLNEPATFSAANSKYGTSTNGSLFTWNFGDGNISNTTNETFNHTYTHVTPTTNFPDGPGNYSGSLTITTSGGQSNTTNFYVWVVASSPTAVLASNATAAEMKVAGSTPYLELNWSTQLSFNANSSTVPTGNVLSIAAYSLVATKHVHKAANFTVASGATVGANWSVDFSPPQTMGTGHYLHAAKVGVTTISPFFGWEYNLTLTVWSGTGTESNTTLAILISDTQAPTSAFTVLNGAGKAISGTSIVEAKNGTAKVELNAASAVDPNNGTISNFNWHISNNNNSSLFHVVKNYTSVKPYPTFWLAPEPTPYTINLTVTDAAGNTANHTMSLTVTANATTRPIMSASTLTGPTSLTQGKSATFWLNVTNSGGSGSTAKFVNVTWYVISAAGGGSKRYISASTTFYNYSAGSVVLSSAVHGTLKSLGANKTVRAEMSWSPSFTGNYVLYANVTASNVYVPDEKGGSNVASLSVGIHANPTTQLIEYGGIAAAVIVAIGLLIWWTRRPARRAGGSAKSTGRGGLERGSKKPGTDESDDEGT